MELTVVVWIVMRLLLNSVIEGNLLADNNLTEIVSTSHPLNSNSGNTTSFVDQWTDLTTASSTVTQSEDLPRVGTLPDLQINVHSLCVCNLLVEQCDINCCCDPDCRKSDRVTFTTCDIKIVTDDRKLCNQEAAMYTLNWNKSVSLINPSIFCIKTNNYRAGSSFFAPEVPTTHNFGRLMKQFGGSSFSTPNPPTTSRSNSTARGYQYGVPVKAVDDFLRLPAPLATSECTDNNPAGFLVNQATHCSRRFDIAANCSNFRALSIQHYLNFRILPSPNASSDSAIHLLLTSINVRSLNGTLTHPSDHAANNWLPGLHNDICRNVVLEVNYVIVYNDKGKIVNASAAFILGAIENNTVPIQQHFQITFVQDNTTGVPLSGNPGYIVGLPLVAGFGPNASFGIIQSKNRLGQLTVIKSSTNQDCLWMEGLRTPVLFGYNLHSGCTLRITNSTTCHQWSQIIRNLLIGQNFPQIVASFGNSPVQYVKDWVTIKQFTSRAQSCDCEVPQSLALRVMWTKYGSLINPQAKIVDVTQTIRKTCIMIPLKSAKTLHISTSVTFTDMSASAQPGYKMRPTIDAKLPYDFFFPFL
ncbi:tectonic-1 isoform X2 [Stegostoma tigrinum]|uniref:tectonic-1 isoform X2 n=1 Tax=Stegostoma tigrinum TaxID=3053191 RepID=UPI002870863A|nr:tectonic-1 isoform X2 [Stegostoma tigrinum]